MIHGRWKQRSGIARVRVSTLVDVLARREAGPSPCAFARLGLVADEARHARCAAFAGARGTAGGTKNTCELDGLVDGDLAQLRIRHPPLYAPKQKKDRRILPRERIRERRVVGEVLVQPKFFVPPGASLDTL